MIDFFDVFARWAPLANVLTATFTLCILLFAASAVRKLEAIHQELTKTGNQAK